MKCKIFYLPFVHHRYYVPQRIFFVIRTDILVIGCGIAGSTVALKAADAGLQVTVITGTMNPNECNTAYAQGGIIYKGIHDSDAALIQDIWIAGCQKGFQPAIEQLVKLGPRCVEDILIQRLQVPFDKSSDGSFDLTSEGGHGVPRIIHVADATGASIQEHFQKALQKHPNIQFYKGCTAIDLLTLGHSSLHAEDLYKPQACFGAYVFFQQSKKVEPIVAHETILATGGVGGLFLHSSNTENARGDGIAMANRAGARIVNMEYIQFHPTGLYHPTLPRVLLSESLRGEGAVLINHLGEAFMGKYHPSGNLAPRDVVARAIDDQMVQYQKQFVFLDITHKDPNWIHQRFPMITNLCKKYGYDITKEPVPVVPLAHYSCGGVLVDLTGNSTIRNLRAIGEVSCTGIHGANRLASTSLLECLVWGVRAAEDISAHWNKEFIPPDVAPWQYQKEPQDLSLIHQDWQTLRNTLWNYVGPTRSYKRLQRAQAILRNLQMEVENFYSQAELSDELIGVRNGVEAGLVILNGAVHNRTSIGCHYYKQTMRSG
jgi:L-aspartate oxidase